METTKIQKIYFIAAIVFALLFIVLRRQPFEYFLLVVLGLFIGSFFQDKLKIIFIVSSLMWFLASFFDPIFRPILKFGFNTVGFLWQSVVLNSILLALFWIGFYIGKKYH
ncbi:MAG: hypothetical protein A3D39_01655 [Candidatus Buchananbacteria bacterium RIFCSPHIGHO2_02_FULL_39_17]|nr:MAG: hypothetical protein A3D39_01655 [Candidatus Buchananbacteria bacterium RIFCSPHIGHO2_02_FULL_39_17]